jgi:hypothetical protein
VQVFGQAAGQGSHHFIEGGRQASNVATTVNLGAEARVADRVALARREIASGSGVHDDVDNAPQRAAAVAQPRAARLGCASSTASASTRTRPHTYIHIYIHTHIHTYVCMYDVANVR